MVRARALKFSLVSAFATILIGLPLVCAQDTNALRESLEDAGVEAVYPGDDAYTDASTAFNLRYSLSPVAVTYPTTPEQVGVVVAAGAAQGIDVTARSGGHSYVAGGLGGKNGTLVVDTKNFNTIKIDEEANTVEVGTGNRLGDVARTLNDYGRALPHGRCTYVGVGGHATGGGWGQHSRMWGLLIDHTLSATVVLANGSVVTASDDENPDLFWAVRGSGASFGIVTSFVFATEPVPPLGGTTFQFTWDLSAAEASSALASFQDFVTGDIPSTLGGEIVLMRGSAHGNVSFQFFGVHWDDPETFEDTVAPFVSQFRAPDNTTMTQGDWMTVLKAWVYGDMDTATGVHPHDNFYAKSVMVPEATGLSQASMDAFIEYLATDGYDTELGWFVEIELYGGANSAINAVPVDTTSFAHRDKLFNLQLYAYEPTTTSLYPDSGFSFVDGMANSVVQNEKADWGYGAYINYPDDRLQSWQHLIYGEHYSRLTELKSISDPENVFNYPHSVERS
ncbi:FAD-binding domain-containing protein [Schizophyllum commune Tattone D]|nr:FAD-binding domain-containing protein [Schizophyllum commune Tattone D]